MADNINDKVRQICWKALQLNEEFKDTLSMDEIDVKLQPLRKELIDVLKDSDLETVRIWNVEYKGSQLLLGDI